MVHDFEVGFKTGRITIYTGHEESREYKRILIHPIWDRARNCWPGWDLDTENPVLGGDVSPWGVEIPVFVDFRDFLEKAVKKPASYRPNMAKMVRNGQIWPLLTKMASFDQSGQFRPKTGQFRTTFARKSLKK